MTAKELKRLTRSDLLEILFSLSEENELLTQKLEEAKKQLEERSVLLEDLGSVAEASLKLNGVFEAAQAACDQYQENVRLRYANMELECQRREQETLEKCDAMERETQARCRKMLEEARLEAEAKIQNAQQIAGELYEAFITESKE